MASAEEAIKKDAGSELVEELPLDDSKTVKPPSEENLPKEDDSKSQVVSKAESEAIEKCEDPDKKKPEKCEDPEKEKPQETKEEVSQKCPSVTSGLKELSESENKSTGDDKISPGDGSKGSLQSSEEKSEGSSQTSFMSPKGSSSSDAISEGYVKVTLVSSTVSLASSSSPSIDTSSLAESLKVLSRSLGSVDSRNNVTGEDRKPRSGSTKSTESTESLSGACAGGKSANDGKVEGDPKPPAESPVTEEGASQKRKGGLTKRILSMSFGSKPKTPKRPSAGDKIKSPKISEVPDKQSEKTDGPSKPAEEATSPKKKSKSTKKSDGLDESTEKTKSPKKSKKQNQPKNVKSPESKAVSPIKSTRKTFFQAVGSPISTFTQMFQKLSPGNDPKGVSKRPICSSTCDPDFFVQSPQLSPISNERYFFTSYVGKMSKASNANTDRIDYSKLAEEKIISTFLTSRECYDVMPISGKVIVLSVDLLVKNAFSALVTNEIKAAPLWDSGLHDFVGFLTITDFINVLRHYFYSSPEDIKDIENQSISTWRRITQIPNRFVKVNGSDSLVEATKLLIQEGLHRIPVFDEKRQCVLFVLTKKRLLHFLSIHLFSKLDELNIKAPSFFKKTMRELGIGTYENIATVSETTKVIDALDLFVERGVSSLPVINEHGVLTDIFGKMDVFALAKEQMYHDLEITVYEVLNKGVPRECAIICTLEESFGSVIQRFVNTKSHRIVVMDGRRDVVGVVSLSDLLKFLVLDPLAALDGAAGNTSDIIEEGAEGAVGGADGDAVFEELETGTGEADKDESLVVNSMKSLEISKEEESVEDVSKSE